MTTHTHTQVNKNHMSRDYTAMSHRLCTHQHTVPNEEDKGFNTVHTQSHIIIIIIINHTQTLYPPT